MAARKTAEATPEVEEVKAAEEVKTVAKEKAAESVYTAKELAANHKAFGTYREIVEVALRLAKKETATFDEAKRIVDAFKNKEVK